MPNQEQQDLRWLRLAIINGFEMSKDPSRKLGSIIVASDGKKTSLGYNGFPGGLSETEERWKRPEKYRYVIHAEMNAMAQLTFNALGSTIYCMLRPCYRCIGPLISTGVKRFVWFTDTVPLKDDDPEATFNMLAECHCDYTEYLWDPLTLKLISIYGYTHDGYHLNIEPGEDS